MVRKINKRSQCLRHRNLVAMVIFMAGIVIYLKSDLWLSSLTPTPQHHSTYRQINSSTLAVVSKNVTSDKISKRVILWYNAPSYVKRARNFKPTQLCPQLNCEYTTDRKRSTLSQVVIFDAHTLPKHPPNKLPHQKWVFFSQESPIAIKSENLNSNEWLFKFDLTATYRRDSDIPTPYGIIKARDGETPVIAKNYTDIFIRKKMAAVWMVSHCLTHSKRESLV
ncbi:hypothetical protein SNE40_013665 [Patella caerulea]|uniref:Fucosyltransferase N-terminal domain-containing protein n=1 Tax=Patella caerulea TaxID=87958 RepID=A0AAN8JGD8_PATCE